MHSWLWKKRKNYSKKTFLLYALIWLNFEQIKGKWLITQISNREWNAKPKLIPSERGTGTQRLAESEIQFLMNFCRDAQEGKHRPHRKPEFMNTCAFVNTHRKKNVMGKNEKWKNGWKALVFYHSMKLLSIDHLIGRHSAVVHQLQRPTSYHA